MIANNTSDEGGVFYGIDNSYEIYFKNTIFYGNSALDSLISIENSLKTYFINTTFNNNTNLLFSCSSSKINLLFSIIKNSRCTDFSPACVAYLKAKSVLLIDTVQIQNVNNLNAEGVIRLDNSYLIMSKSHLISMKTTKKLGSCISGLSSFLEINALYVENYDRNCIFLEEAFINLSKSFFTNYKNQFEEIKLFDAIQGNFGTIFCKNCFSFNLSANVFDSNSNVQNGGAISLSSLSLNSSNGISSCSFINMKSENQGGALFLENVNIEIYNTSFFGNIASEGGAIFLKGICLKKNKEIK